MRSEPGNESLFWAFISMLVIFFGGIVGTQLLPSTLSYMERLGVLVTIMLLTFIVPMIIVVCSSPKEEN